MLARELGGEIIGADSRQVYRHMEIGTAKPTVEQRALVPHHLIDVIDPDEPFGLAQYLELAAGAIDNVRNRCRLPILVGGTGQYS
ncbi:MAG: tRNA (adenosine(37)-N6)-dimethylallyltransferase MiaA, partial [Dehalococcoidia bacterium]